MMQARDVMVRGVISVGPDIPVQIAANAMVRNCVSALPVIDIHVKLVGIVSEGDLIRRVEIGTERRRPLMSSDAQAKEFVKSHAKRVSDVMTREVITAQPETPLREIVNLMEKHSIKRVPIVQDKQRADRNRITRRVPALNPCEAQANAVARNPARMPPIKRYFTV